MLWQGDRRKAVKGGTCGTGRRKGGKVSTGAFEGPAGTEKGDNGNCSTITSNASMWSQKLRRTKRT